MTCFNDNCGSANTNSTKSKKLLHNNQLKSITGNTQNNDIKINEKPIQIETFPLPKAENATVMCIGQYNTKNYFKNEFNCILALW